jgi:hypothetical protein
MDKQTQLRELQTIPGLGKSISQDFWNIGIRSISDLKGQNSEKLYQKICQFQGKQIDRCLLYVCRCAIYFAQHKNPDSEKCKWWNWKDK